MKFKLVITTLLVSAFTLLLAGCFPAPSEDAKQEFHLQGRTMGTTYNIKVVAKQDQYDLTLLQQDIDAALVEVNNQMSTYQQDSEITVFNNSQGSKPTAISTGFRTVVTEALRLGDITDGMLNVTVGPLVNIWGFGPDLKPEKVPSVEEQAAAFARIGLEKLVLTEQGLAKTQADVYIDLSTIAKGWGVDVVADLLEGKGIQNYLVEIGGEMRLKGFKANGTLWHIAVEKPITTERSVHQVIVPQDNAVATSGDYRNYIEVDDKRYSHIINPKTGKPIDHRLVSVTVIHPSSMTADGLSTAIMVMGPEKGLAFAEQHDLAVMMISKTDKGFEEINTKKFMPFLK
ncbi:FAD:protein FMN transferase [Thalassotalea euphylliae]|uniref:FAD:protein FMN transferase n=1 Tax=Thalassotalea euphylliae TaxID=1655234 RepID=A0A3E0U1M0_9GAMM|nr:FAD:protein FMN transferase [Thalassotalea euphylliae]REL30609.1 FAD:protein FMN transferase [Thalassotalea euphylliae]